MLEKQKRIYLQSPNLTKLRLLVKTNKLMIETYTTNFIKHPPLEDIEQLKLKPQKLVKMYTVNFGSQHPSTSKVNTSVHTSLLHEAKKLKYSFNSMCDSQSRIGAWSMNKQTSRLRGLNSSMLLVLPINNMPVRYVKGGAAVPKFPGPFKAPRPDFPTSTGNLFSPSFRRPLNFTGGSSFPAQSVRHAPYIGGVGEPPGAISHISRSAKPSKTFRTNENITIRGGNYAWVPPRTSTPSSSSAHTVMEATTMMHGPRGSAKFTDAFRVSEANSFSDAAARIGFAGAAYTTGLITFYEGWNVVMNYAAEEETSLFKGSPTLKHLSKTVKVSTMGESIEGSIID